MYIYICVCVPTYPNKKKQCPLASASIFARYAGSLNAIDC